MRRSPAEIAVLNAAQRKPDAPVGVDALAKALEGIEKLPGKPGTAGKDGLRGPIGPPGEFVAGPPGSPGRDGIDGLPGRNGKSITGPRGLQGEPGRDGIGPDEKVKLDAVDPESGYLEDKLKPGLGIKFRRSKNDSALVIDATGGGGGIRVSGGGGAHPNLAAHDALGLATDDALAAHALTPHGGAGADDQTAAEVPFTPAGGIAATDVQAAIEEVAAEAGAGTLAEVLAAGNDTGGVGIVNAATGANAANVSASATTVTGSASADHSAIVASGNGNASAILDTQARGVGSATATVTATSEDGLADTSGYATANGSGNAFSDDQAQSATGNASAQKIATVVSGAGTATAKIGAIHGADTAAVTVEADSTSARLKVNDGDSVGTAGEFLGSDGAGLTTWQPPVAIQDEGTPVVSTGTVDFAGAGVSVAQVGAKAVVTVPGGALPADLQNIVDNWAVDTDGRALVNLASSGGAAQDGFSIVADELPSDTVDLFTIRVPAVLPDTGEYQLFNVSSDGSLEIRPANGGSVGVVIDEALIAAGGSWEILKVVGVAGRPGKFVAQMGEGSGPVSKGFKVGSGGFIVAKQNAAPADADLEPGDMGFWLDDTPGATAFKIKAKDSAGTVRTATVPLT